MQIKASRYFERGHLTKCRQNAAVAQDRRNQFQYSERFATNYGAPIPRRAAAVNQRMAVFLPTGPQ